MTSAAPAWFLRGPLRSLLALITVCGLLSPAARAQDARRKQEILFDEVAPRTLGDGPFVVAARSTSGLPVVLVVVSGPAKLDGKTVTLTGAPGLVILRASQQGDAAFLPARDAERAFEVRGAPSPPRLLSQPEGTVGELGAPILLSVQVAGEPAPTFQWRKNGIPITGATSRALAIPVAALSDAGTYDVLVSNPSGAVASAEVRVTVGKRQQMITFQYPGSLTAGQPVVLNATATSGLPVQFEIVSGLGTLSGQVLTAQAGTVVVQATQPGDMTFEAATPATQAFTFTAGPGQRVPGT